MVCRLKPVILAEKYIAINNPIATKIAFDFGSVTVVPFFNVNSFEAKSLLSFM